MLYVLFPVVALMVLAIKVKLIFSENILFLLKSKLFISERMYVSISWAKSAFKARSLQDSHIIQL